MALKELRVASQLNLTYLDPSAVAAMERSYAKSGRHGFFAQSVVSFRQYPHPAYSQALAYAALNENDKAVKLLEEAYRNHDLDVLSMKCSPELDGLRSLPRYQNVKQRINLP